MKSESKSKPMKWRNKSTARHNERNMHITIHHRLKGLQFEIFSYDCCREDP